MYLNVYLTNNIKDDCIHGKLILCENNFFLSFYWEIIDIYHCIRFMYTAWWFDLHRLWSDSRSRLSWHPSSHTKNKEKKLLFVKRTLRIHSVSFPMCRSDNSRHFFLHCIPSIHLLTESLYLFNTFFQLPIPSASGNYRNCCIIWQ